MAGNRDEVQAVNFIWVGHVDTFPVMPILAKMDPAHWRGVQARGEIGDTRLPARSILLRAHNKPTVENWLEDLPVHDCPEIEKWASMKRLLDRARKQILQHNLLRAALDNSAPIARAMLTVLEPGGTIMWHRDDGPYHDKHARFHIPLVTNPGVTLYSGNEQVHMPVGSVWWFNNRAVHSAANWGASMRIHLIFEMRRINGEADG